MNNNQNINVSPVTRLRGEMRVPGDKSISHRAALIAALAENRSTLRNFSSAADCASTINCLRALGVSITHEGEQIIIEGVGRSGLKEPVAELDAGNSGTTMRLLAGVLAGQSFTSTITGDESLRSRPMRRITEPLRMMGAQIEMGSDGCAPLRIHGQSLLRPINYRLPIASAQVKSAVLLAGLAADGETSVEEPTPTRDHTERMLRGFGASVDKAGNRITIRKGATLRSPGAVNVPGDISSAAFFIAAAVMLPSSDLRILDVGLNPTRTAFLDVLKEMGADIRNEDERTDCGELLGTLNIRGHRPQRAGAVAISGAVIANLIDELPLLAFVAAAQGCELEVRDAAELRVKESDRIRATIENLRQMGAPALERQDGWWIGRADKLRGAQLSSFGDHRIAMACAVASLAAEGESQIEGAGAAVGVSLPEFWSLLEGVSE